MEEYPYLNKLKNIPTKPGVYIFRDEVGKILYIGKAKNLRNRVRSYFQKNKYQTPKNQSLIARIIDLEWIVVGSEVEALLTEANLIRKHKPKYNISLKDDKSFPYIRITNEPFPQVFLTRNIIKDGSKYFGPYTNVVLLRQTLKAIHKVFPIRSCSYVINDNVIESGKVKICLDYHIKKCGGPCEGFVSENDYKSMIKQVNQFLQGDTKETQQSLTSDMVQASQDMRFEDAAIIRDQLTAIRDYKERQMKVANDFEDRDVFALAQEDDIGVMAIVRIRQGRIFSREKISLQGLDEQKGATLRSTILQFYLDGDFIPKHILMPFEPDEKDEIIEFLKNKRGGAIKILVPQRGEKAREIRIAYQNAKLLLGEWLLNRIKRRDAVSGSVKQLQDDLNMEAPPRRIEAFDISHLGGTNTVASMVCFMDGKPRKKEYRKFNIKTVDGIDDFASMREVVYRRYKRVQDEEKPLPDLILIDGGKGQLSMAVSALRELGLDYITIIGLAKRLEEVFMPGNSDPQSIAKQSSGLKLLQQVRDEAHRFAITFQREKRSKDMTRSVFSHIKGMGQARIKKLFEEFRSIDEIAASSVEIIREKTVFPNEICIQIIKIAQEYDEVKSNTKVPK
ncbi:MAG: excinuclease ABC subunit C [Candidatus Marinimicrobia bacterium]|nr:excinuclease ABC subunit C [Candidatus Neomarinimicrobiota bacterium]